MEEHDSRQKGVKVSFAFTHSSRCPEWYHLCCVTRTMLSAVSQADNWLFCFLSPNKPIRNPILSHLAITAKMTLFEFQLDHKARRREQNKLIHLIKSLLYQCQRSTFNQQIPLYSPLILCWGWVPTPVGASQTNSTIHWQALWLAWLSLAWMKYLHIYNDRTLFVKAWPLCHGLAWRQKESGEWIVPANQSMAMLRFMYTSSHWAEWLKLQLATPYSIDPRRSNLQGKLLWLT